MEYVTLGRGGPSVSRVAFGCAAIGGADYGPADDADSLRAAHQAIDLGINFFDVADVYGFGRAERVLGEALASKSSANVIVATKGGVRWDDRGRTQRDSSPDWISTAIDASLSRLRVERIDLYQLHWPDPKTPIEDTLDLLERRREDGKIGQIGCTNFPLPLIDRAQRATRLD
ncbi:MAG TPA: aldo/keto reductase, partial [Gemmatimonadaceae bacterium]|nr:aldo/keto reductase [Gemmatimonadaceae bacterium]